MFGCLYRHNPWRCILHCEASNKTQTMHSHQLLVPSPLPLVSLLHWPRILEHPLLLAISSWLMDHLCTSPSTIISASRGTNLSDPNVFVGSLPKAGATVFPNGLPKKLFHFNEASSWWVLRIPLTNQKRLSGRNGMDRLSRDFHWRGCVVVGCAN